MFVKGNQVTQLVEQGLSLIMFIVIVDYLSSQTRQYECQMFEVL